MRLKALRRLTFYTGLLALGSCLDVYEAPRDLQDVEVLVIDGFLNGTDRNAYINISHAQPLSSDLPPQVESGATVSIFADNGDRFTLVETQPGLYTLSNINVDPNGKYQLRIGTARGGQYTSDYVEIRQAPPITGVAIEPNGEQSALEILLSAKDPTGLTRYYRWDYIETWEYTSTFRSDFKMVDKQIVPRIAGEGVYRCYRSQTSTRIMIGTSIHLSDDVINDQLLTTIPTGDQRLHARYSVEVRQRAITRHEFEYLKQLQLSTENLGGLFDPAPSQLYGNVRNVSDTSIPVLGYFTAGSTQKFRAFYDHDNLPTSMKVPLERGNCLQDTVCITIPNPWGLKCNVELKTMKGTEVITGTLFKEFETIGFLVSTPDCADCRTQGGVTTPPEFW